MLKKINLIVSLVVVFGWGQFIALAHVHAQTLTVELPDKNLQACIEALAKKNNWQAIEDVTKIQCHNKGIENIEGLQQFTRLQKLSLHKNKINKASLNALPEIKEINIARNNLSEIKLSNLPKLEALYLFGNQFQQLELKGFPALEQIKANSSGIHHFHYADLPSLQKIYMFDNQMETIDIYSLPALKYMDVRQNPMPDGLYEEMDKMPNMTILHDGNAEDWQ